MLLTKPAKKALKESLLAHLRGTLGIVTPACELAGCSREFYYALYREDEDFKQRVDDLAEVQLDFGESKLLELMQGNDPSSIQFFMKTKGRKRGYGVEKKDELPTPEASNRKLVMLSFRKRPEPPEQPSNLPALI